MFLATSGVMPHCDAWYEVLISQAMPGATKCFSLFSSSMSSASSSVNEAW